jgi:uncharacterized membrane protein
MATGQLLCSSVIMSILAFSFDDPSQLIGASMESWGALLGLSLLSTSFAYIIFFRVVAKSGPANVLLVTMLIPVSAIAMGITVLGETLDTMEIIGTIVIILALVIIDGRVRMEELVCDGALVATPAGSTAYNYSAHGPILPIGADVLALTAMAAFRPRRWRGALLPKTAVVRFEVLEAEKRPVMADADSRGSVRAVASVEVRSEPGVRHRILFDPGHGLEERLINEQFV